MINFVKSYFVNTALKLGYLNKVDMIAWVDFGYPRFDHEVPSGLWDYNFDPDKIHFFSIKRNVPDNMDIYDVISHNNVFIMGCHIVASGENWKYLEREVWDNMLFLNQHNLVDDDQTLLYMCYCNDPEKFQIHYIDEHDGGWFQLFTKFRNA